MNKQLAALRLVAVDEEEWCRTVARAARAQQAEAREQALRAAIEDYALWEPGRAGHAAAHRRLLAALNPATPEPHAD
jgi:hypothetical protein